MDAATIVNITTENNRYVVYVKDNQTGQEYKTSFGPYTNNYQVNQTIHLEGVLIDSTNSPSGLSLLTTKIDDTVLRAQFPGRPSWALNRQG